MRYHGSVGLVEIQVQPQFGCEFEAVREMVEVLMPDEKAAVAVWSVVDSPFQMECVRLQHYILDPAHLQQQSPYMLVVGSEDKELDSGWIVHFEGELAYEYFEVLRFGASLEDAFHFDLPRAIERFS